MKEMLKSKGMVLFMVMFIGITYINAIGIQKMEKTSHDNNEVYSIKY